MKLNCIYQEHVSLICTLCIRIILVKALITFQPWSYEIKSQTHDSRIHIDTNWTPEQEKMYTIIPHPCLDPYGFLTTCICDLYLYCRELSTEHPDQRTYVCNCRVHISSQLAGNITLVSWSPHDEEFYCYSGVRTGWVIVLAAADDIFTSYCNILCVIFVIFTCFHAWAK